MLLSYIVYSLRLVLDLSRRWTGEKEEETFFFLSLFPEERCIIQVETQLAIPPSSSQSEFLIGTSVVSRNCMQLYFFFLSGACTDFFSLSFRVLESLI